MRNKPNEGVIITNFHFKSKMQINVINLMVVEVLINVTLRRGKMIVNDLLT
jgi:hypothetical protein